MNQQSDSVYKNCFNKCRLYF